MNNFLLLALIFTISASAFAAGLTEVKGKGAVLVLKSKNCQQLVTQHQSICQWKKSLEPSFTLPEISESNCRALDGDEFEVTVTDCLPSFVQQYQNQPLQRAGANCWGTALSFKGHSIRPRYIWSEEMLYWLESPLCRKLEVGEERKSGDVMMVYGPEYLFDEKEEIPEGTNFWKALYPDRITATETTFGYTGYQSVFHAETFISEDLTFGKQSPAHDDYFKFTAMDEVYANPHGKCHLNQEEVPVLRENQNVAPENGVACTYLSHAYRCGNMDQFFAAEALSEMEQKLMDQIKMLQVEQDKLFPLLLKKRHSLSKLEIKRIFKLSDLTARETLLELSKRDHGKKVEMLLTWKYFSATGLRKTLELAKVK